VPPTGVVTVTSTAPAASGGLTALMLVTLLKMTPVAASAPKATVLNAVNPVPVIVTKVAPLLGPLTGRIEATVGTATKVNTSPADGALVPPTGVVTVTSTAPAASGGLTALMLVTLLKMTPVAASAPKATVLNA